MSARSNIAGLVALLTVLVCSPASANIEPSSYDAKSIAAGTTGMAYLDNPSALAINPANLTGIDRGGVPSVVRSMSKLHQGCQPDSCMQA